jgi:hypothetical protein
MSIKLAESKRERSWDQENSPQIQQRFSLDEQFSGLMLEIYFSSKVLNFAKSLSTDLASSENS